MSSFGSAAALPWVQAAALACALLVALIPGWAASPALPVVATMVFLVGGLPHGAFDIHRVLARAQLGHRPLVVFGALYVAILIVALMFWRIAPQIILPVFLLTAIVHFAEDWPEVEEPLYRAALGFAPLCAIGVGHPDAVAAIFAAMSSEAAGAVVSRGFLLLAPVTILVAAVGLAVTARTVCWHRPALFAGLIAALFVLPPLVGFALFFCAFHTPRHMIGIRRELSRHAPLRLVLIGAGLSGLAVLIGLVFAPQLLSGGVLSAAAGFQLLAALALPHQNAGWMERVLARRANAGRAPGMVPDARLTS
ncbi:hypothetical protein A9995_13580 [Erythrobacter sp. QSSC1-22B]|nr:hypothetical protein A9995_13580 [Erythrobacter sp. QSSC1-22B]